MAGQYDNAPGRKKLAIIGVSSLILVAMVVAVAVGVNSQKKSHSGEAVSSPDQISTSSRSIQEICQPTDYRQTCEQSLNKVAANTTDPNKLVQAGFQVAIDALEAAIQNSSTLNEAAKDPMAKQAVENCKELMGTAIEDLKNSIAQVGEFDMSKLDDLVDNLKVWLSATITYQQTCIDGFDNTTGETGEKMRKILLTSSQLSSNSLAMATALSTVFDELNLSAITGRKLLGANNNELPSWVSQSKRRLLAATPATIKADITVAQDGSGQYKIINDAIKNIPKKSTKTFVVYVKAGIYKEIVTFSRSLTNIMLIGDGPTKTKISGNQSFAGGVATLKTSTVSISGAHFIAKDIGFENTAGPEGHQAVALKVQADMAIFYNCRMDGFQNTLFAHTYRQFYRDCEITGTIDIIFGNSAAVFQNCKLVVKKPLEMQECTVTAQGRNDSRQATGFVIQNSTITAEKDYYPVKSENPAFLGRPQYPYSRTIVMQTQIDDMIDPQGWQEWMGTYGIDTCFYAEYENKGPGAVATKRAKWKGIKTITAEEAASFTAGKFIEGDSWISKTGVPYVSGMM